MNRHYVLLIHGIGNQGGGFSKSLEENVLEACEGYVGEILGQRQDPRTSIDVHEVLWADATQGVQDELWKRLYGNRLGGKVYSLWSWTDPSKWFVRAQDMALLREFVVSYLGDTVAYDEPALADAAPVPPTKYDKIHNRVMNKIDACAADALGKGATQNDPALLTIVAHSFGSVIAKDLYDDCINRRYNRRWPDQLKLANFITLGSPLALYAVQYDRLEDFRPIDVPAPGVWLNVYDPQDILGFPLKPLHGPGGQFDQAVRADIRLNAGSVFNPLSWTPLSHEYYWNDSTVAKIIGRKLAIDYAKEGSLLPPADIQRRYDAYDEWVRNI